MRTFSPTARVRIKSRNQNWFFAGTIVAAIAWIVSGCGTQTSESVNRRTQLPGNYQGNDNQQPNDDNSIYTRGDISISIIDPRIKKFDFDIEQIKSRPRKINGIDFDYAFALQALNPTKPEIAVLLGNSEIAALGKNLGVVIGGYPMNNSGNYFASNTATEISDRGILLVRGENFSPGTPYKVLLHFYDLSQSVEKPRYVGSSSRTYYLVTDGRNDPVTTARSRILTRGFAELSDWDLGRYDRSKRYTEDSGSGWCHLFYDWVVRPDLYTRSGSQYTHYNSSYWQKYGAVRTGAEIAQLNATTPVHGDFFRVGSHAAMIIAYDQATGRFNTLEGNFNNSVELYRRSPSELSWVGHIQEQMLPGID